MNRRDFLRMALASPLLAACGKLIGDDKMATLEELMKPMIDASVARGEMSASNAALLRDKLRYESGIASVTGGWIKAGSATPSFESFEFRNASILSGGRFPNEGWRLLDTVGTTVQSVTDTPLDLGTPDFDTADEWDQSGFFSSAASTQITIPTGQDGIYLIGGRFIWNQIADGKKAAGSIRINDTTTIAGQTETMGAANTTILSCVMPYELSAGDYIEWNGYHEDTGGILCKVSAWGFRWR